MRCLHGQRHSQRLDNLPQRREARVAARRQRPVKTLPLNPRLLSNLRDPPRLGNRRGVVTLHAKAFAGLRRGVLIAESIWPNEAFEDGHGINTLTGADQPAPAGGSPFHDNRVWLMAA